MTGLDPEAEQVAGDPWLFLRLRKVSPTLKLVDRLASVLPLQCGARGDVNRSRSRYLDCESRRGEVSGTPAGELLGASG